jgi:acetyl-CoA carboxylase biotin carboxyl carrier protein
MSAEPTGASEPFNLEKLRELIGLMEAHGLSEIDLRRGEERWKLRRGSPEAMQLVPAPGYAAPAPIPVAAPAPAAPGPVDDPNVVAIKSPTVGTFYESSAPGDAPFVAVGSRVTQESVVCIIEAMKVFNQITADLNGTVTGILVKNGDAVEFGQPLFRVRLG